MDSRWFSFLAFDIKELVLKDRRMVDTTPIHNLLLRLAYCYLIDNKPSKRYVDECIYCELTGWSNDKLRWTNPTIHTYFARVLRKQVYNIQVCARHHNILNKYQLNVSARNMKQVMNEYKRVIKNCEYMFKTKNQMTTLFMILYYNKHIPQVVIPYFDKSCILCKRRLYASDEAPYTEFRVCDICYISMFKITATSRVDIKLIERWLISIFSIDVYKLIAYHI
jgi:hypothetical protein